MNYHCPKDDTMYMQHTIHWVVIFPDLLNTEGSRPRVHLPRKLWEHSTTQYYHCKSRLK